MVDGVVAVRGLGFEGDRFDVDDPRLTGTMAAPLNWDVLEDNESGVIVLETIDFRIDNGDGSWTGQGTNLAPEAEAAE